MSTILFKFVFTDNSSPAVVLTDVELTGVDEPVVNISTTAFADGAVASLVSGGQLTYDEYTKSWGYRLIEADLAAHLYVGMAVTTYASASPQSVHALGMVVPDALVSSRSDFDPATDTVEQVESVLNIPGQQVRDAMLLAPSGAAADGSVMDYLSDMPANVWSYATRTLTQSSTGSGATAYSITVQDEDSNPIDGVEVWITTDSAGTNVVAGTLSTDALGLATFMLDAGDYYVWRQRSGYNFTNPVAITVS